MHCSLTLLLQLLFFAFVVPAAEKFSVLRSAPGLAGHSRSGCRRLGARCARSCVQSCAPLIAAAAHDWTVPAATLAQPASQRAVCAAADATSAAAMRWRRDPLRGGEDAQNVQARGWRGRAASGCSDALLPQQSAAGAFSTGWRAAIALHCTAAAAAAAHCAHTQVIVTIIAHIRSSALPPHSHRTRPAPTHPVAALATRSASPNSGFSCRLS